MSIQTRLFIDEKEFIVEQHYFSFFQNADQTGRPISKPMNRTFDFVIHGSQDTTFFEWSIHPQMIKNCKITFSSKFGTSKSNTVELLDTHCLFYKLHYQHDSSSPMMVYFSLSPATILFNGQEMLSHWWRKTDPELLGQPVIEREDEHTEPKVIDYYITDLNSKRIQSVKPDDKIILNIHTKNMIDELFTINLDNPNVDFKYNGEILANDTLKDYLIEKNLEKIELEVIKQD
ncbi:type VI secretion system tube protein TssD [uncultured Aquimarina sp.]|uniref:type VI secretion system tube protein TssD n=1 Tax=uncultured Aquimarina sp. TaxID=575652 RepID=UPI0026263137|nr:type VI secretion system tube protein TssD [uncultured Aquimarina sp.]